MSAGASFTARTLAGVRLGVPAVVSYNNQVSSLDRSNGHFLRCLLPPCRPTAVAFPNRESLISLIEERIDEARKALWWAELVRDSSAHPDLGRNGGDRAG